MKQIDDEREDNLLDPEFDAEKMTLQIETDLIDRTKTNMLHDKIKGRFVPTLEIVCNQLGEEYTEASFSISQKKIIDEHAYVMEIHYQTSK